uniref:Uncharacterized protein n=1 Tax=Leersia perrieri TaxID=77586 RepID=A0A0D9WWG2_9ORYZ
MGFVARANSNSTVAWATYMMEPQLSSSLFLVMYRVRYSLVIGVANNFGKLMQLPLGDGPSKRKAGGFVDDESSKIESKLDVVHVNSHQMEATKDDFQELEAKRELVITENDEQRSPLMMELMKQNNSGYITLSSDDESDEVMITLSMIMDIAHI